MLDNNRLPIGRERTYIYALTYTLKLKARFQATKHASHTSQNVNAKMDSPVNAPKHVVNGKGKHIT